MRPSSLYQQVMGDDFLRLPSAVQRFHRLSGTHHFEGWVETHAPATWMARVLATCLGSPQRATQGRIRFELDASGGTETWTRHFPSQTMRSRLTQQGAFVEERLGAATLRFTLHASGPGLSMALRSMGFLGIPCPRWMLPSVVAEEHGDGDRFHFRVLAALPFVGTVAHYEGHLVLGPETEAASSVACSETPQGSAV